ncbi:leucine-rich repeat, immunoglobulin-like domain and transmembrane domain-containing protein 3b [Boleophthalmus pectinirostris]|uniref:leucine-rich repeat, immunoglobulin-like domain and transmembrane domain-containing protein 3b n=1 Tax=Boleophthalmus pectinirostris TaxID=150288 RepID=UPI00242CAEEE|nr:leucine-rich repeat, immunoglobulin-like domain and transmembrane domain-containing protein 3b [Boleophthalmus pectinirostris]
MFPLWVLLLLQWSTTRVLSCPSLCTCTSAQATEEPRSVLCNDPELLTVPTNVPVNTVKLRLEKTQISRLPRAAFYNLSELRFLWLTYSALRSVHPSSFVNLKTLRELRLDGNQLTAFPWEGLRDMPRLQILDLHNNRLSSLPAHAALSLANITFLDLSSNSVPSNPCPVVADLGIPDCCVMDMFCRLVLLPAELLDLWFPLPGQQQTTVQRRVLGLHDNPWQCDCQISMVASLSVSLGSPVVLVDPVLMCVRSVGQGGALLMPVQWSRCMRPSVQPAATRVVSPLGSNVILRCEATGYPTPTLSWVKAAAHTDCCQQEIPPDADQLPKSLPSFMQGSPRVGVRWSVISLNGLSYKDAGEYRCQAKNMAGISEAPIKLRVLGSSRANRPQKKPPLPPPKQPPTKSNRRPNQVPPLDSIRVLQETLQNSTALNKTLIYPDMSKITPDRKTKRRKMKLLNKSKTDVKQSNNSTLQRAMQVA